MDVLAAIKREEKKAPKTVANATAPIERSACGRKSFGRFDEQRNKGRKEARLVGCWPSGDC
jgi:hypothetical protein